MLDTVGFGTTQFLKLDSKFARLLYYGLTPNGNDN